MRLHARTGKGFLALLMSLALVGAACGGGGSDDDTSKTTGTPTTGVTDDGDDNMTPQPGGELVYGLEADTTGGYCLAEAQLAISGIQVARAVYDTLTMPNDDGEITPYLAESVTANDKNDTFTIKLREGVTFHDGTKLDADIVRDNILAWSGQYEKRKPVLFRFVFANVDTVKSDGPLTVVVTTKKPWPSFPWFLWLSSRAGIMGRAQLDDTENCNTNLVGTGPFKFVEAVANQRIVVEKNPNYWQTDADGNKLPYLDKITFVPQESESARLDSLKGGDLDIMHTASLNVIGELRDQDTLKSIESNKYGEVSYLLLNGTIAPFDSLTARQAVAYAIDRDLYNERLSNGLGTPAQGPFGPGSMGFLEDAGYPEYDPEKAKELVAKYEQDSGEKLEFTYTFSSDPEGVRTAEFLQQILAESGITMNLNPVGDQSTLINLAIGRAQQAIGWRNHPGGDPDLQYVWWHCSAPEGQPCDNLVNFGGWNDPEINKLLDEGRAEADQAKRKTIYENLNREFAKKLYDLWAGYTLWSIASQPTVHGVFGQPLPDGSEPAKGLATGHSVLGLWIEQK